MNQSIKIEPVELAAHHRTNLRLLEKYLRGALREGTSFNMGEFADSDHFYTPSLECGSVGCAVGHGPYAGIPKVADDSWRMYAARQFGADDRRIWRWCFFGAWIASDNTAIGAANRIRFLLDHNGIPADFDYPSSQWAEVYTPAILLDAGK